MSGQGLHQEPLRDGSVSVDAAIAPERPVAADILDAVHVDFSEQYRLFVVRGLGNNLAEGISDKRAAPEFQAFAGGFVAANVAGFEAHAVYRRNINAVGDGVRRAEWCAMRHIALRRIALSRRDASQSPLDKTERLRLAQP